MMNRNHGRAGMQGVGLLGEGPGLGDHREPMGRGFKRMMAGERMGGGGAERMQGRRPMANARAGDGLMGNAPMEQRRLPADSGMGRRDPFDAYDRPAVRGLLDEPDRRADHRVDHLRPVDRRPILDELDVRRGVLDDGRRGGGGLLDHRAEARAMVEQRMGQFADRSELMEEDMRLRDQEEGRGLLERAEYREAHGIESRMMDRERRMAEMDDRRLGLLEQRSLRMAAAEQREFRDPVDVERERYHEAEQRRGLMDQARQSMDAPDMRRGLIDQARTGRVDPLEMRRGLLDPPRQAGLMDTPDMHRGLLDQPRQGLLDRPERQDGLLDRPRRRPEYEPRLDRQTEMLEKADLQMRLLQEEQLQIEVERVNHEMLEQHHRENEVREMQQRAIVAMQQQRPTPQQAMMKAQMQVQREQRPGPRDGLLGSAPMPGGPPGRQGPPRRGPGIPSLLDMGGKPGLRKRPSADMRPADNKKPRTWQSSGSSDRPQRDARRDSRSRDTRDRPSRDADRKTRFDASSASKSKDRKDVPKKSSSEMKSDDKKSIKSEEKKSVKSEEKKGVKSEEKKGVKKEDTTTVVSITMDNSKYDPSEPTEDEGQQGEEHMGEEVDDGKEKTEEDKSEKGLTVTVSKKGRSVNDPDKKIEDKETMYKCNVCSVKCFDEQSFGRHMNGVRHKKMMDAVMQSSSRSAALFSARKQAEEHLRNIEGTKKPGSPEKAPRPARREPTEMLCKACDKMFSGSFKDHKESPEHKIREDKSKAGCRICNVSTFKCFTDYVRHLKGDWHIKKKRQSSWPECKVCDQRFKSPRKFVQHCKTDHHKKNKRDAGEEDDELEDLEELVTLDTVGFEEDAHAPADVKPPAGSMGKGKVSTSTPRAGSKPMAIEKITPVVTSDEVEDVIPEQYDPNAVVGGKYIVPVSGFFCKLCHKFYNNETAARVTHCQSKAHYEKLLAHCEKLMKVLAPKKSGASQQKTEDSSDAKDVDQSEKAPADESHLNGSKEGDQSSLQEVSTYETADEHESTLQDDDVQDDSMATSVSINVTPEANSVVKKKTTPQRAGQKARRGRKL